MIRENCSKTALILLAAGWIGLSVPAYADKGGNGHGRGSHHEDFDHDGDDHDRNGDTVIIINNPDRAVIRQYIAEDWHHHCPPGLAKKHNGCLPPGQAKKRWSIGHRLPDNIVLVPVSGDLLSQLQPVPSGYQYVQVDKDVLLISEAGKKVIDAVTLLSAVGK